MFREGGLACDVKVYHIVYCAWRRPRSTHSAIVLQHGRESPGNLSYVARLGGLDLMSYTVHCNYDVKHDTITPAC